VIEICLNNIKKRKRAAFSILPKSKEKHLCVWPAVTRHMLELFFALWQNAKGCAFSFFNII
jgi:hypothetical protein